MKDDDNTETYLAADAIRAWIDREAGQ